MKKNNKAFFNLISSVLSVGLTLMLLIVTVFAWYITNTQATASGIVAASKGLSGEFSLYYWDKAESEWEIVGDSIVVDSAYPGDILYFKLVSTSLEPGQEIGAHFEGIESRLNSSVVGAKKEGSNYIVTYKGVPMYSSTTSTIKDSDNNTVYNVTSTLPSYTVSLVDYKIENAFKLYTAPSIVGGVPSGKGTEKNDSLNDEIFSATASSSSTSLTNYFAISFDESESGKDNYFQYQSLYINTLVINM